jgi:dihydroneopterin aldolase
MDHIFIRDLRIDARVGFHKRERHAAQTLRLDLEIGIANDAVFASDRVADCIARVLIDELGAAFARVSVAKLGVMKGAGLVGVSVERRR